MPYATSADTFSTLRAHRASTKVASRVQVRERLGEALPAKLVDLVLEPLGHAAHGRLADTLAEQRLGDAGHVARRHPAHVRRGHGVVDLGLPARVPSERCGRRAPGARASHAHGHLAGGGHHVPVVPAIPDVDALVTALVRPGPDESLQLLVEDDLDGRLHRAAHALGEVDLKVLLRRDHGVDSVEAERSFWLLHGKSPWSQQPGGSLVFSCGSRNRLLHNYRDTTPTHDPKNRSI
jgi:hypothetical protein